MRAIFVTDIHLGAAVEGFQMQPRWFEGTPRLLEGFAARVRELQPDLVMIGGDTVDRGVAGQVEWVARFLAKFQARTVVCLGNHDLTNPDSMAIWREKLQGLGHVTLADALVPLTECDVIALNTYWQDENNVPRLQWDCRYPRAAMPREQGQALEGWLGMSPDRPAIVVMHGHLNGVPAELCGREKGFEAPAAGFAEAVRSVMDRYSRVRLVLSGHCHVVHAVRGAARVEMTGTSFTEPPFQFQVVELDNEVMSVRTERVVLDGAPKIVAERAWVCGRECDRQFQV